MDIKLQIFEGPLELLRNQLKKNKISIYDIDISLITDQYIEAIQELSLDSISEFILMAAELISIKNKMLLWTPKEPDPREELTNRLEIYEFFREMALGLKSMENSSKVYRKEKIETVDVLQINHTIDKLNEVYLSLLKNLTKEEKEHPTILVEREDYTIEEKIAYINENIKIGETVTFTSLVQMVRSKIELVTVFMALLELIKARVVCISQRDNFADINITKVS